MSYRLSGKSLMALLLALVMLLALASAVYFFTASTYTIYDGEAYALVSGHFQTVEDVLDSAGTEIRPQDQISPPLTDTVNTEQAIQITRAKKISLRQQGEMRTLWTTQPTLAAFLAEAGITVRRTDTVIADGKTAPFSKLDETSLPSEIEIRPYKAISLHDGDTVLQVATNAQTVGEAIEEAGITVYAMDSVEPSLGSWLADGSDIYVVRSIPLVLRVDGQTIETRSHYKSSLNVLNAAGIALVGQDFVQPGPEKRLEPGDEIEVIRVRTDFRFEDQLLPFDTVWQPTDQLEIDQRAVLSQGAPGILRQRIRVRFENGVEAGQLPDATWVEREPVNEVIGYGTAINVRILETEDGPIEYWRVVRMRATAYTARSAGKPPDHPAYGITASGVSAGTGVVAVDPDVIPFRSWVYVPGYGVGFAGDTGGGVKGRWIDLGFDEDELVAWNGYADVYYLTPVPPPEEINWLIPAALP